jgi:hypothetical protein
MADTEFEIFCSNNKPQDKFWTIREVFVVLVSISLPVKCKNLQIRSSSTNHQSICGHYSFVSKVWHRRWILHNARHQKTDLKLRKFKFPWQVSTISQMYEMRKHSFIVLLSCSTFSNDFFCHLLGQKNGNIQQHPLQFLHRFWVQTTHK